MLVIPKRGSRYPARRYSREALCRRSASIWKPEWCCTLPAMRDAVQPELFISLLCKKLFRLPDKRLEECRSPHPHRAKSHLALLSKWASSLRLPLAVGYQRNQDFKRKKKYAVNHFNMWEDRICKLLDASKQLPGTTYVSSTPLMLYDVQMLVSVTTCFIREMH